MKTDRVPFKRRLIYLYFSVRHRLDALLYDLGLWRGPTPVPHGIKRRIVRGYAREFNARTLVETGTYMGDMLAGMLSNFDELYSIELSPIYYERAQLRFARRPKVRLLCGDSGEKLAELLPRLQNRTLFWLDAHFSGGNTARGAIDTPIMQELARILGRPDSRDVVLIDDARCFIGHDGYPTIDEVRQYVTSKRPDYDVELSEDIIRLTPRQS